MARTITCQELIDRLASILVAHGLAPSSAGVIAGRMAAAERDGAVSHGLLRLPGYLTALDGGWVDGAAVPLVEDRAPGVLAVDARNGFAQVALETGCAALVRKARDTGVAVMAIRNTHHLAALWPDLEPFADEGFVAFTFVNARSRLVIWDGDKKVLGTNPMAFACPRADGPPLVFDQASSVVAQGELLVAAREGRLVADDVGVDAAGKPTRDPNAILDGGTMRPFGGHKGAAIALMVEVMAAALTGGPFGFEHEQAGAPGQSARKGQSVILIDPVRTAGASFASRIEDLLGAVMDSGVSRLPGSQRYERRRRAEADGISLSPDEWALLDTLSPP